jgi:uncharacterized coiled-coil protein SlyX
MSNGTESTEKIAEKDSAAAESAAGEPAGDGGAQESPPNALTAADEVAVVKETSFDTVITRVLDASDVANKTASIAADSTGQLIAATGAMRDAAQKAHMHSIIVLGISGFALIAAVGVFTLMALQLQARIESADATVLAVGKRVVQLNSGIGSIKQIEEIIEKINERQQGQAVAMEKLVPRLDTGMAELRKTITEQAEKAAKTPTPPPQQPPQADPRVLALQAQIKALEPQLQAQARATAKLADQLAAMQANLAKINGVARNVETLISMEKQKPVAVSPVPVAAPAAAPVVAPVAAAPKEKERVERPNPSFVRYPNPPKEAAKPAVEAAPGAR